MAASARRWPAWLACFALLVGLVHVYQHDARAEALTAQSDGYEDCLLGSQPVGLADGAPALPSFSARGQTMVWPVSPTIPHRFCSRHPSRAPPLTIPR